MAFTLNTIDFSIYGVIPARAPGSNLAVEGCFDFPARFGKTFHEWRDADEIEPYVDAADISFIGRDIVVNGHIFGTRKEVAGHLSDLFFDINAVTGTHALSTPYGDFNVRVQAVEVTNYNGGSSFKMLCREPVADLSGGTLPASGFSSYTFDSIPFESFGFYTNRGRGYDKLMEFKDQMFTKYGTEGFQPTKRKPTKLNLEGYIVGDSLNEFRQHIKNLYLLFSSPGERGIKLNDEIIATGFAPEGFKITNVIATDTAVVANFAIDILCTSSEYLDALTTEEGTEIETE